MKITLHDPALAPLIPNLPQFLADFVGYVRRLDPGLDLSGLREIVFTNAFGKEIHDFAAAHGLPPDAAYDDIGNPFGKAFTIGASHWIFIRVEALVSIVSATATEKGREESVHLLHHELAHVHDHNRNARIRAVVVSGTDDKARSGLALWEEYYVSALTAGTMPRTRYYGLQDALDAHQAITGHILEIKNTNRQSLDVLGLFTACHPLISQFALVLCYALGYLDALLPERGQTRRLEEAFGALPAFDAVLALRAELRSLQLTYPNWPDASVLPPVFDAYLGLWRMWGIQVALRDGRFDMTCEFAAE